MDEVSAVIPTRNRPESILQLLKDLSKQLYPLKQVIIVDSSDEKMDQEKLSQEFKSLNILYLSSEPSVCIQRNLGIAASDAPFIFLCDDDITLPENYVRLLMEHLKESNAGAASGLILQKDRDEWQHSYPPSSFSRLCFAFIFQHSVWGDVKGVKVKFWQRPFYRAIKRYYRQKENALSLAGWPLITLFKSPAFRTTVYGLGASIIKKEWLINSPYDEVLDPHGIGDNYGVAMGFPEEKPIHVVCAAKAYHYQSGENRLESATTYYRRLVALHYFLKKYSRFGWWHQLWFGWSLFGNLLLFRNRAGHRKATVKVLRLVLSNKNPYWQATKRGEKVLELEY